jgi:predicted nucleotidyltransferase
MSLRVPKAQRETIRAVARALKRDPEMAKRINATLEGAPTSTPVGPFRDESAALTFLRDRLVAFLHPDEIWLFGSRARGDARPDSDFDLLVVFPDSMGKAANDYRRAREPVSATGLGVDVVPCLRSSFVAARDRPGTIVNEVVREGKLIYTRDKSRYPL